MADRRQVALTAQKVERLYQAKRAYDDAPFGLLAATFDELALAARDCGWNILDHGLKSWTEAFLRGTGR